jgi:glycosyltransferase involved in cell wall biosynthesis
MGVPVVTTDAGGMAEVVEAGAHGLVVDRRDPRALARAFATLAADPGRRRGMGERAVARAQDFAVGPHLDAIEQILVTAATDQRAAGASQE